MKCHSWRKYQSDQVRCCRRDLSPVYVHKPLRTAESGFCIWTLPQMLDILRDAPLGQIIRYLSGNRILRYLEEKPDYELPYTATITTDHSTRLSDSATLSLHEDRLEQPMDPTNVSGSPTPRPNERRLENQRALTGAQMTKKVPSMPVMSAHLQDDTIIVRWYTTDDPENPQMWSSSKKSFVAFQIWYPETFSCPYL